MMTNNFYDTCSLLIRAENLFDNVETENIIISSISLQELEEIKTSTRKDEKTKYAARKLLHILHDNPSLYTIWIYREDMYVPLAEKHIVENNDSRILACALDCETTSYPDNLNFITNDLALAAIANLFFGSDSISEVRDDSFDEYSGSLEVTLNPEEMSEFYNDLSYNHFNALVNQYVLVKEAETNEIVDAYKWTGSAHEPLKYKPINSSHLGLLKPRDWYQRCAMDLLANSQLAVLVGRAGSGKSIISLTWALSQLEKGKVERLYIVCNPIAVRGAGKLGFLPGTREEKLLDSQIGNFLSAKLGGLEPVMQLIDRGKLFLMPLADIRGVDLGSDLPTILYMTEAQNTSIDLMKLILQRAGENCQVIIEGDYNQQVDLNEYEGFNNGLRRVLEVFKGQDYFGAVNLQKVQRSRLAEKADEL